MSPWIWKSLLALAGIVAGAYVGQELIGGGALGGAATGAIVAGSCYPLFGSVLRYRREKDAAKKR